MAVGGIDIACETVMIGVIIAALAILFFPFELRSSLLYYMIAVIGNVYAAELVQRFFLLQLLWSEKGTAHPAKISLFTGILRNFKGNDAYRPLFIGKPAGQNGRSATEAAEFCCRIIGTQDLSAALRTGENSCFKGKEFFCVIFLFQGIRIKGCLAVITFHQLIFNAEFQITATVWAFVHRISFLFYNS